MCLYETLLLLQRRIKSRQKDTVVALVEMSRADIPFVVVFSLSLCYKHTQKGREREREKGELGWMTEMDVFIGGRRRREKKETFRPR